MKLRPRPRFHVMQIGRLPHILWMRGEERLDEKIFAARMPCPRFKSHFFGHARISRLGLHSPAWKIRRPGPDVDSARRGIHVPAECPLIRFGPRMIAVDMIP